MLPWLHPGEAFNDEDYEREGGFSVVKRYRIDPDSHGFHDLLKSVSLHAGFVAVKTLKKIKDPKDPMYHHDWRKEVNLLLRFSGMQHPYLVTLLATFTKNDTNHLLFPCAEYDLDEFWEKKSGPLVEEGDIDLGHMQWVSEQIKGLTEALKFIHAPLRKDLDPSEMYGRHGDLKPENILWFASPTDKRGILVITDLGIAAVHREVSKSNIPNQDVPRTPGYRPPECDIKEGKISRAFDIWTIGCLFLEKACWLLGGDDMRSEFAEGRLQTYQVTGAVTPIFFDIQKSEESGKCVLMVKESVTEVCI
ncbi:hypothetical protein G7Z17_g7896 [Cylindrodendrum hubeiense]|uniref:Protein kinase domain-containing protein n=1 Tax=Cylindrodendrum hubeiense TaxID=595255 RepID=A0A9P5H7F8_9HYPO|nr:hypothetical protein G7Z17_g7896 [Cylindrodendrum hubeiense]